MDELPADFKYPILTDGDFMCWTPTTYRGYMAVDRTYLSLPLLGLSLAWTGTVAVTVTVPVRLWAEMVRDISARFILMDDVSRRFGRVAGSGYSTVERRSDARAFGEEGKDVGRFDWPRRRRVAAPPGVIPGQCWAWIIWVNRQFWARKILGGQSYVSVDKIRCAM